MYIKDELIQQELIEQREYQISIARSAAKKNTLVVLPTGMGKTIIALLLIADTLKKKDEKILFLAPTKPLVIQHAQFLKDFLTINQESIVVFTGEISPMKRQMMWNKGRIIVSTPQVIENDLLSKRISFKDVSFMIFDEAHHAVGDYSYVFVSEMYKSQRERRHILGITASPGNDIKRILEVCKNLDISNIEIRTKYDSDVKPYVHELQVSWKEVPLPKEFTNTIQLLRKALAERLQVLKDVQCIESASVSLINRTKLLEAQKRIQQEIRSREKPPKLLFQAASKQSAALKIYYAIELLQTQGVNALRNYIQRLGKEALSKGGSKSSKYILSDANVVEAIAYVKSLNIEHPKTAEIIKIVQHQLASKPDSRIIIFTHYRDTSSYVVKLLTTVENAYPVRFIGQSKRNGDKGLTQKEQAVIIDKFKRGDYNILIATSVAEEGLDIPSTDLVVFFEPVPSEIRAIQRRGRTGRKMPGKVVILIAKDTPDQAYYWASKRKEKHMRAELELLRVKLNKHFEHIQALYERSTVDAVPQKTLQEYHNKQKYTHILVDHREYRSSVVRNLLVKDVTIEPQQLDIGDYILSSRIGVERKTTDDFLDSLLNGKLFKQISRLRDAYSRPILIIEGEGLLTKRNINHNAIFGSIVSIIVDFGIPIITTKNPMETADLLFVTANREQRQEKKTVTIRGRKTSMSLREQQQFMIEGLPNISATLAKRLLAHFGSIKDIVNASKQELCSISGIGETIASNIVELLNAQHPEE